MRKFEDIEERFIVLARALTILAEIVEDTTDPRMLAELNRRYEAIEVEFAQLQRDRKMAEYRLHAGLYP